MIGIILASLLAIQLPPVQWFDDFLGVKLNPAYAKSFSNPETATIQIAPDVGGNGGLVFLSVVGYAPGAARLRLGEDPVTGGIPALTFSAKKNLVYESRVFLNRNTDTAATVGLIGYSDPDNVLALILDYSGPEWRFQAVNDGKGTTMPTGFLHEPGKWFTVKIVAEWGDVPVARVYINGEETPRAEISGIYVPAGGLCPEFQLWNKPLDTGAYSQPTMWIDYLSVRQDRESKQQ